MAGQKPTLTLLKTQYTLSYGMRLDRGTASEFAHPHVAVPLPDGTEGGMALHVINGTPEEIKAWLLESVDAFFELHADA
jgi:hypothetical protein